MSRILIVDDEVGIRELLSEILEDEGYEILLAENAAQARQLKAKQPDLVLLDIWMPDTDGVTLLKEWAANGELNTPVIMMSGHATIDTAVEATKIGAVDFLEKPITLQKLLQTIQRVLKQQAAPVYAVSLAQLGKSELIQQLEKRLDKLIQQTEPVLLLEEDGSGAEYCAQLFSRPQTPWITVDSPYKLTDEPIALLQMAKGGGLFIPNIERLTKPAQKGLLLILSRLDKYPTRVIMTSQASLAHLMQDVQFDRSLYYLVSRLTLAIPPLRDHKDDLPYLINRFLEQFKQHNKTSRIEISAAAQQILLDYPWPGNLLELENVLQSVLVTQLSPVVQVADIQRVLAQYQRELPPSTWPISLDLPLKEARDCFERFYLEHHIRQAQGNISRVAEKIGLERTHLYRKLKQLGINSMGQRINSETD